MPRNALARTVTQRRSTDADAARHALLRNRRRAQGVSRERNAAARGTARPRKRRRENPRAQVAAFAYGSASIRAATTTKLALVADDGQLIDSFYANNEGDPLQVARRALIDLHGEYADAGVALDIAGVGTTGYGELLFHRALHADYHTVETVAHAHAATRYVPDVSFILDIGGQDMKAIWLSDGVIGNIVVNEACSSGCGSFLENFAQTLGIPTPEIADAAFASEQPAVLGSRCTVFMNSSIVSEQNNGRTPADIMAGLCRSIIANVFTKVVRVPNLDSLGEHIVVQGGTFRNDAVLCALEQRIGRPVTRAPYPGLMGAIGVALLTREHMTKQADEQVKKAACKADSHTPAPASSTFIGFDALGALSYRQHANVACPFCANRCNRTVIAFADGTTFVTGNRCPRGEIVGDPKDPATRSALKAANEQSKAGENLFETRQKLLFQDWPIEQIAPDRGITIGIPRVLAFWDTMPFWNVLLRSLGFAIRLSRPSTRAMFEEGLPRSHPIPSASPQSSCTGTSTSSHAPASTASSCPSSPPCPARARHPPAYPCAPW